MAVVGGNLWGLEDRAGRVCPEAPAWSQNLNADLGKRTELIGEKLVFSNSHNITSSSVMFLCSSLSALLSWVPASKHLLLPFLPLPPVSYSQLAACGKPSQTL